MNKQDIIKQLTNTQLEAHERESLSQLLHYMNSESVNNTSSNNNTNNSHKRSSTSSNRKGNNHTSSNNKHTR
jgi:hypothetical protein